MPTFLKYKKAIRTLRPNFRKRQRLAASQSLSTLTRESDWRFQWLKGRRKRRFFLYRFLRAAETPIQTSANPSLTARGG
jgi:hypothetical protein